MRIWSAPPVLLTTAMALWSTTALAEASEDGAAKLLSVFQTYLGSTEGVVQVAVDGDVYKVRFDAAPLIALLPDEAEATLAISPVEMTVVENGDGTWDYAVDQSLSIAYAVGDAFKSTTDYGQVLFTGTFDEALGDTSSYQLELNDMTTEQIQHDANMGEVSVKISQDQMTAEGTAMAGASGVDTEFSSGAGEARYEVTVAGSETMAPMAISASVEKAEATGSITGLQSRGIYGLLAYFVANADTMQGDVDRAGMKTALQAALPVFETLTMTGSYSGISAETPMGPVALREVGMAVDANGVVADGKFREAISLKGLSLPEGVIPPFAVPLVPSEISLDVMGSGFDLAAPAALGLGLLDLPKGATPPEGLDAQFLAAFLPAGSVDITIAPGEIYAPAYRLTYEGAMAAGPAMPMPVGKARIGLTGMDKINEALMASPPEMGLQDAAPMLGMAQMMAQQGVDGELIWEVETTATGGLSVNGQVMMAGGQ